jgi:hypothetical protein
MTLPYDRAHEVLDKACEKLDHWPHDFIGQEDLVMLIFAAIEAQTAEQTKVTAQAERDECLKILQKAYQEWFDGDHSPGEAFENARDRIRARSEAGK